MMKAAQTNLQLYAQLQASGWSDEHLALTARAYDLAVELVGARVRHSGKPFVANSSALRASPSRSASRRWESSSDSSTRSIALAIGA